jgi:hypothetical protein
MLMDKQLVLEVEMVVVAILYHNHYKIILVIFFL